MHTCSLAPQSIVNRGVARLADGGIGRLYTRQSIRTVSIQSLPDNRVKVTQKESDVQTEQQGQ